MIAYLVAMFILVISGFAMLYSCIACLKPHWPAFFLAIISAIVIALTSNHKQEAWNAVDKFIKEAQKTIP